MPDMLTDTHAHLDFSDFDADREAVMARAAEAGVSRVVTIGTDVTGSRAAIDLARRFPGVHAVVGLHPCYVREADAGWLDAIRTLASEPGVVALGEMGLDYHHLPGRTMPEGAGRAEADARDMQAQREALVAQLDLACELGLNVVIHQRESWDDTLAVLTPYTGRLRAVFHCFGGTPEQVEQLESMGHLVSFTGIITFKSAEVVRRSAAVAREYLVETDCPYLAPVPHRGRRCEPAHARLVAEAVAAARGVTLEAVARETQQTAEKFFAFGRRSGLHEGT
jgi:TatD DNase family protein